MVSEQVQQFRGIMQESVGILRRYSRLFFLLALTLILPLCFLFLAHRLVSAPLVHKIGRNMDFIETHEGSPAAVRRETALVSEWASLIFFFIGYNLFVLAFSLLSTAAVVYSVACIYTDMSVSYAKVLGVVPTVWKRLSITFFWVFLIMSSYHIGSILILTILIDNVSGFNAIIVFVVLVPVVAVTYLLLVYISCIWHLASVITVLEDDYGIAALRKSFKLIQGRRSLAHILFSLYLACVASIGTAFQVYVVDHSSYGMLTRLLQGMVLVALLTFVTLFGMIAQTVFYFACKVFHNEQIDWSSLSEHLGAYMGEYIPLKSTIEMESL